ncbi:MAG TPA: hypothetical protein PKY30_23015 [Myxococcota bacterium]|nr:hypothetical protein [Myxococcota bacterium]
MLRAFARMPAARVVADPRASSSPGPRVWIGEEGTDSDGGGAGNPVASGRHGFCYSLAAPRNQRGKG